MNTEPEINPFEFHGTLQSGQQWFVTEIKAMHPMRKEIAIFGGPNVPGISVSDAQNYCNDNIGYCQVVGRLIAEIPTKADGLTPDFVRALNYDTQEN